MTDLTVFSVQDETGTVIQLTAAPSPLLTVSVGDQGMYAGIPDLGTDASAPPSPQDLPFTVVQVLNAQQFSIHTTNLNAAQWARDGVVTWTAGANIGLQSQIDRVDGANAYIDVDFYRLYFMARGVAIGTPADLALQGAIVQASDYLDQRYRFRGVKLVQTITSLPMDSNAVLLESWLTPFALTGVPFLASSISTQTTQWPRQGAIDNNGNQINGIPENLRRATAELAQRVLAGISLQPDYDPNVVANGAVVEQVTKKVGPIETSTRYDTKLGLGFFPTYPQVTRLLKSGGLLTSSGGRSIIR